MVIALTASESPLDALQIALPEAERARVAQALEFIGPLYAGRTLGTGEPALDHALGMARGIADLRLDADARLAALLFTVPAYLPEWESKLERLFGATAVRLVSGIWRVNRLRVVLRETAAADQSAARSAQIEVLRKMLLAMVEDVRVVILRLASRTQSLRYLTRAPEEARRPIARETLDLYAPLANRLGAWQLKWELEDLSFRFLEPELYKRIAGMLDEKRIERESFIAQAIGELDCALKEAGVNAQITGRPKHIYSIYSKMKAKGLDFSRVYDVRGLRVLVDEVGDCYTALGVVHDLWQPIAEEFDDYISRPKANLYRSLHTAVAGPDGRPLEVQIRTHEMHRYAELGVAAHWRYKEAVAKQAPAAAGFDQRIDMLRQMLAWRDEVVDASGWVEQFKGTALDDTVYVLTPQGRVIDLPQGSTPIDFAYAVHSALGHRCRGARVNGSIVPLDYKLKNGECVEIIAAKAGSASAGPSRDWLNPALGYIASSRARQKVRQWFNSLELGQTIAAGRSIVEKELQREGRTGANLEALARGLGFARPDDLFAAVGREEVGMRQLKLAIRGESGAEARKGLREPPATPVSRKPAAAGGILVLGVDRLLTQLAGCCKPAPPERISGFVTRGRGVSIHRRECASLARLAERYPERLLEAQWGDKPSAGEVFPVDIAIRASDRPGLLRDVSDALGREHVRVAGSQSYIRDGAATLFLTVEVRSLDDLKRTLPIVQNLSGVLSARRR